MIRHIGLFIAGLFFVLSAVPVIAAETTRGAVPHRVDALSIVDGQIVLNDQVFFYNSSTAVYRTNGALGTVNDLRLGMRVIIQILPSQPSHKPILTTIRIQP